MATKTETLPVIDISYEQTVLTGAIGKLKGPVESFVPMNNEALQSLILTTRRLPEGIFTNCQMFDSTFTGAADQLAMRRDAVRAESVVRTLEERADEEEIPMDVDGRLLKLFVDASSAQAVMVEAARQYHNEKAAGSLTEERAAWLKEVLATAQDEIYSPLDPEIAAIALDTIEAKARGEAYAGPEILSADTRQAWHEFLHAKFDPVFERVYAQFDDDQEIIGEHLTDMTRAFMRESGLPMAKHMDDHEGWDAEYKAEKSGFNVESAIKRVMCGRRKDALSRLQFEKLMIHEIIRHAWTAENGSRTGYRALQTGLPGFNEPEEGGGILFEVFWSGEDPMELGRDHFRYVATAFSDGIYDGIKHSEQETFDYTADLMARTGVHNDDELYRHVLRPFRAMPDGCRMRSNAAYFAGKIGVMYDIEAQFRAGVPVATTFTAFTEAKINSLNPEQIELKELAKRQHHAMAYSHNS